MPVSDAHRRLAVVLATDIVGYSRMMAADEEATLATLGVYHEAIDHLVAEHRGRVFSRAGDGMLAEFASAVEAVRCAVAIQRMAERRNADLPQPQRMLFRIGLNLGDVVARGCDLLGDGVNVAARLQALAEPRQICIAAAVNEQIAGKLDFPCRSLGQHNLKNLPRPVHVYSVGWALPAPVTVEALRSGALPLPDRPSIAVLPFANMSEETEHEYFADGLSEDLITALAKYRWFFVIARNSSFSYKGCSVPLQQVGRELGVRYVLEGSTRRSGNRIRVTAQLVEAETGHHLWAERYDRELQELFALQDEIVGRVVATIEPGMMKSEGARARRKTSESLDAWDLVFRGMWHFHQVTREHHHRARELFRGAIAADPSLAEGYIWLIRVINGMMIFGWSENRDADLAEEAEAVRVGMRFGDGDPYAHYALAIHCNAAGHPDQAIAAAQRAIDLSPSFALGHYVLGAARMWAGRAAQAIEPFQRGRRLNPHDPQAFMWLQFMALAHYLQGRYAEAADCAGEAAAMRPDSHTGQGVLALCLAGVGRLVDARQVAEDLRRAAPAPHVMDEFTSRFVVAGERELIRECLRRAGWQEPARAAG